jgi:hypothetical protein
MGHPLGEPVGYTSGSCVLLLSAVNPAQLSFTLMASIGSSSRDSFEAPRSTLVMDPLAILRAARALRLGYPAHLIHQAKALFVARGRRSNQN